MTQIALLTPDPSDRSYIGRWPEVLERETSEVDDDVQPSTSADVQRLLSLIQKMDERQRRSELLVVDAIIPPGR